MAQCVAAPLSREQIRKMAWIVRKAAGEEKQLYFDIVRFLDVVLPKIDPEFSLIIRGKRKAGGMPWIDIP